MEQLGYNQTDLVKVIGFKSRLSEILTKKRKLSLDTIRKLNSSLNIPAEVLTKEY
jgi:HTH-type transcriptional regulator / antitoxin HigA